MNPTASLLVVPGGLPPAHRRSVRPWARGLLAALLLATLATGSHARGARADVLELEDGDRATLMKEQMKQRREASGRGARGAAPSSDRCGSVEIGNDPEPRKGSTRVAERDRTVIVTGNVYNTAVCR